MGAELRGVVCEMEELAELSKGVLSNGSRLRLQVRGVSMSPTIRDGDVIEVAPATFQGLRVGDVVFYVLDTGSILAHRLIHISRCGEQPFALTMGDACRNCDPPVFPEQIAGKVTAVRREGRLLRIDSGVERWSRVLLDLVTLVSVRIRRARIRLIRIVREG